jgi:ADP-L-glycero-D-manno-heptose 6-epimerase
VIIVTGGAGFIGSNLVHGLNQIGEKDILVVDNLKTGMKHRNLSGLDVADYCDRGDFLDSLKKFRKIRAIFHIGACSSTMEWDGLYMMKNNYEYSKTVMNWSQQHRVPLIYASSASVYGNGEKGFKENRTCEYPLNVYAYSKFLFDQQVRQVLAQKPKSPVVGLRFFNVYGPQENHKGKMASVILHFFNKSNRATVLVFLREVRVSNATLSLSATWSR